MAKPYFEESSKQLADLFDQPIDDKQIDRIILSTFIETPKSNCLVLGLISEHMYIEDVLGNLKHGLKCNVDFKIKLEKKGWSLENFEDEIYKNYELNRETNRNLMSMVYLKQRVPPYHPLFFIQLCVPIGNLGIALLNKRKNYIYLGKYIESLEDVIKYNSVTDSLNVQNRILTRYSVENMIENSKIIHSRLMEKFYNNLEETRAYSEKPF